MSKIVRFSTYCPTCDESEDKPFPLYRLADGTLGCEADLEADQDEADFVRANKGDFDFDVARWG